MRSARRSAAVLVGAVTRIRKSSRLCGRGQKDISDPARLAPVLSGRAASLDPVLSGHAASLDPVQFGRASVLLDTRAARSGDTARRPAAQTRPGRKEGTPAWKKHPTWGRGGRGRGTGRGTRRVQLVRERGTRRVQLVREGGGGGRGAPAGERGELEDGLDDGGRLACTGRAEHDVRHRRNLAQGTRYVRLVQRQGTRRVRSVRRHWTRRVRSAPRSN
jgi:hypothetical protein